MTWRDKLENGLMEDAPFRKDNPEIRLARGDHSASRDRAALSFVPKPDRRSLAPRPGVDTGCRRRHTDLDV